MPSPPFPLRSQAVPLPRHDDPYTTPRPPRMQLPPRTHPPQNDHARPPRGILRNSPATHIPSPHDPPQNPHAPAPAPAPPPTSSPYHHHHTSSSPDLRPRADNAWVSRTRPCPQQHTSDLAQPPDPPQPVHTSHIIHRPHPDQDDSLHRRSGFAARVSPHLVPGLRGRSASDVRILHTPPPDLEPDRLARACGQFSPITPYRHDDRRRQPVPNTPTISPSHPPLPKARISHMYRRLDALVRRASHRAMDYVPFEEIAVIHKRDSHLREQLRRKKCDRLQEKDPNFHAVGAPLEDVLLYASTPIVIGDHQHYLPLIVVACVEELTKTGIYQFGLFRALPSRDRHLQLIDLFDKSPDFGAQFNMRGQSMPDICALLSTFLSSLPAPLLDQPIYSALWHWSVKPSVQRADARRDRQEEEEEDRRARGEPPQRGSWQNHTDLYLDDTDIVFETDQLAIAQILLRFLPSASLSMLVYLCSFFTQLPLCPENGLQLEDVARIFGHRLLGGSVKLVSQRMFMWLLTRWHRISDGLFGDTCGMTPPTSPTHVVPRGTPVGEGSHERIEKRKGKREGGSDDALRHAASSSSSASASSHVRTHTHPNESPTSRKSSSDGEEDGENSESSRRRKKRELDVPTPRTHDPVRRASTRKEAHHGHGRRASGSRHHRHAHRTRTEPSSPDPFAMAFAKAQVLSPQEVIESPLLMAPPLAGTSAGVTMVRHDAGNDGARGHMDTPARVSRLVEDVPYVARRAADVDVVDVPLMDGAATGTTRALVERVEVLEWALGVRTGPGGVSLGLGHGEADAGVRRRDSVDEDCVRASGGSGSGSEGKGKGRAKDGVPNGMPDPGKHKAVEVDLMKKLRRVEAERDEAQRMVRDMRAYLLDEQIQTLSRG